MISDHLRRRPITRRLEELPDPWKSCSALASPLSSSSSFRWACLPAETGRGCRSSPRTHQADADTYRPPPPLPAASRTLRYDRPRDAQRPLSRLQPVDRTSRSTSRARTNQPQDLGRISPRGLALFKAHPLKNPPAPAKVRRHVSALRQAPIRFPERTTVCSGTFEKTRERCQKEASNGTVNFSRKKKWAKEVWPRCSKDGIKKDPLWRSSA